MDLTDKRWLVVGKMANSEVRSRKHSLCSIVNAMFCLVKTGRQWRMLPLNIAPCPSSRGLADIFVCPTVSRIMIRLTVFLVH
jgi:hypothetical protein